MKIVCTVVKKAHENGRAIAAAAARLHNRGVVVAAAVYDSSAFLFLMKTKHTTVQYTTKILQNLL